MAHPIDDLPEPAVVNKEVPGFNDNFIGFNGATGHDPLLLDPENAFPDPLDSGFGIRNRSMTFTYPANSTQFDLINSLVDSKPEELNRNPNGHISFDFND